jgi:hypothetical protein
VAYNKEAAVEAAAALITLAERAQPAAAPVAEERAAFVAERGMRMAA